MHTVSELRLDNKARLPYAEALQQQSGWGCRDGSAVSERALTTSGGGPAEPHRMESRCACTRRTSCSSCFRPCSALSPASDSISGPSDAVRHVLCNKEEIQAGLGADPGAA